LYKLGGGRWFCARSGERVRDNANNSSSYHNPKCYVGHYLPARRSQRAAAGITPRAYFQALPIYFMFGLCAVFNMAGLIVNSFDFVKHAVFCHAILQ
jgi:hypothetical protein